MKINKILSTCPIIPVVEINQLTDAIPLARALVDGGINIIEITLRTSCALDAIKLISNEIENIIIGVGTINSIKDIENSLAAGASFAVSPGLNNELAKNAMSFKDDLPLLAGISTPSELMQAIEIGFTTLKFFPAEASGGIKMLKSLYGPFPKVQFCPTGGITPLNANDYLALPNVICLGGSWLTPKDAMAQGKWEQITKLAKQAMTFKDSPHTN